MSRHPDPDERSAAPPAGAPAKGSDAIARWSVATLCGAAGEAILVHNGEDYRLRVTSRGRLILTK